MKRKIVFLSSFLLFCMTLSVRADSFSYHDRNRTKTLALDTGIGFTLSPDTFLMNFRSDYFMTHHIAVGPLVQFGISDNVFLIAPSIGVKGVFDLPEEGFAKRVKPFLQGGAGLAYVNVDRNTGDDDDMGFLMNFGFGTDIYLTSSFSLGNNIMFNILPVKVFDDRFFFSWQFVTARYHF